MTGPVLDSQTEALLKACADRNIYSPLDMEYAFQPWALNVERLADALHAVQGGAFLANRFDAEGVALEYNRLTVEARLKGEAA